MTFEQMRDEWEIKTLSHRYAQFVDRGDGKAWAGLFTPDGVLRVGDGTEIGLGVISFRGEFLHFDLGDETVTNGMNGDSLTSSTFENTGDTFRFAINFRLN